MLKSTKFFFIVMTLALLSACATQKKEVEDAFPNQILPIYIKVDPEVNGENSPLYVMVYQLKTTLPFVEMNFETLSRSAYQSLAGSYVNSTEYYLVPDKQKILKMQLRPGVQYIGIFADYKKMGLVKWREIISLNTLKKRKRFSLRFTIKGIQVLDD